MKINRRDFLKTTALTSLYFAGFGTPTYASNGPKKNLVVIMLRGGMDGLCALPIKDDKNFKKLRSKINLDRTLKLTSDFDLHPALETFKKLWDQDQGAAVHATNIPYTGRSHFDGQNLMESGGKIPYQVKTGWLGRGMKSAGLTGKGLALALPMPLLIRGVPMNNNYYPVGDRLPSKETMSIIEQAFKDHDEKLLSENLKIVLTPKIIPMIGIFGGYRLECALRGATILGIFGMGGIGTELQLTLKSLEFREMWTSLWMLGLVMLLIEKLLSWWRNTSLKSVNSQKQFIIFIVTIFFGFPFFRVSKRLTNIFFIISGTPGRTSPPYHSAMRRYGNYAEFGYGIVGIA